MAEDATLIRMQKNINDEEIKNHQATTVDIYDRTKLKDIYDEKELPLEVGLRFSIKEITHINTSEQKYGIKGDINFSWKATDLDQINYQNSNDANRYFPQFAPVLMFINDTDTISWENTPIRIKKKYNLEKVSFNMTFTEEFEVNNFPFDVQDLSVVFKQSRQNRFITHIPSTLWDNYIKLDKTWSSITNWDIVGIDCSVSKIQLRSKQHKDGTDDSYEIITLRIQTRRKWRGIAMRLILWLLILGIMSWSTFAVPATNIGDRLSYSITMALTIVAFQFIISSELPQVNYMTLLDKYNLFTFSFVLSITIESTIVGYNEIGFFDDSEFVDNICAAIFGSVFILGTITFIIQGYRMHHVESNKIGAWKPYKSNVLYVENNKGIFENQVIQECFV